MHRPVFILQKRAQIRFSHRGGDQDYFSSGGAQAMTSEEAINWLEKIARHNSTMRHNDYAEAAALAIAVLREKGDLEELVEIGRTRCARWQEVANEFQARIADLESRIIAQVVQQQNPPMRPEGD